MKKLTKKQHRAEIKRIIEKNNSVDSLRCIQSVADDLENMNDRWVLHAVAELTDLLAASRDEECYKNLTKGDWDKVVMINELLNMEDERLLNLARIYIQALFGR